MSELAKINWGYYLLSICYFFFFDWESGITLLVLTFMLLVANLANTK